jgi:hypothetical protein
MVASSPQAGYYGYAHAPIAQLDRAPASGAGCGRSSRPGGISFLSDALVPHRLTCHCEPFSCSEARRRGNLTALCWPPAAPGLPRRPLEVDSSQ